MANLADAKPRSTAIGRLTANQAAVLPTSRNTRGQSLEVNAQIVGKSRSDAAILKNILGLASDVGSQLTGLAVDNQKKTDKAAVAAGVLGQQSGHPDQQKLSNSEKYAQGYYTSGAQRTVTEIGQKARDEINTLLSDPNNPATVGDINQHLDTLFASVALNADGTPRDFGAPEAKVTMANGLAKIRQDILTQALPIITNQMNEKLADNVAFNIATGGHPEIYSQPETPLGNGVPHAGDIQQLDLPPSQAAPAASVVAPFSGFETVPVTGHLGDARSGGRKHNGEDYAVPTGTPLVAPMGGTVVSTQKNKLGGAQVRVKMDDGSTIGFAHLSQLDVKKGDRVSGGQQLGLSGESGNATGPTVHVTVVQNGKHISPKTYFSTVLGKDIPATDAQMGANADPTLAARMQQPAQVVTPQVDFEKIMALKPPSMSPGDWKAKMIPALITQAENNHQPALLDGLWQSKRADGTPSFNPKEIQTIRDAADQLRQHDRALARQAQHDRWEANADTVVGDIINGHEPSDQTLVDLANQGDLSNDFVHAIITQRQNEAEQAYRQADAESERVYDMQAATLQMERAAGIRAGSSQADDVKRLQDGYFGTGKKAMIRFRQARAAATAANKAVIDSPGGQAVAAQLDETYPRVNTSKSSSLLEQATGPKSNATRLSALSYYADRIDKGDSPAEAFTATKKAYPPGGDAAALEARRKALLSKQ